MQVVCVSLCCVLGRIVELFGALGFSRRRARLCGFDVMRAGGECDMHCVWMGLAGGLWRFLAWWRVD
eukprot:12044937-Alexandrium_andersonii.AAC.1